MAYTPCTTTFRVCGLSLILRFFSLEEHENPDCDDWHAR